MTIYNSNWTFWPLYAFNLYPHLILLQSLTFQEFLIFIIVVPYISYPYVNAKLHSTQPIFIQLKDLHIMIMAVIRSSMSRMGLFMPRSSLSFSMSMFWMTFLVSATMAMALYTALSWATWYSGSNCKISRDMYTKINLLIEILNWDILNHVLFQFSECYVHENICVLFFHFKVIFIQSY